MKSQKSRKQKPFFLENRVFGKNRGSTLASWLAKEHQRAGGMCWCRTHGDSHTHQAFPTEQALEQGAPV